LTLPSLNFKIIFPLKKGIINHDPSKLDNHPGSNNIKLLHKEYEAIIARPVKKTERACIEEAKKNQKPRREEPEEIHEECEIVVNRRHEIHN
jgi:hypothetical protein